MDPTCLSLSTPSAVVSAFDWRWAPCLCREIPPELLIVDEPTNHLDLDSVEQLESALQQYSGALVVISHDPEFLKAIGIEREFLID